MEQVWNTAHIAELCLHSLPAQGLRNGDEHRPKGRRAARGDAEYGARYVMLRVYELPCNMISKIQERKNRHIYYAL